MLITFPFLCVTFLLTSVKPQLASIQLSPNMSSIDINMMKQLLDEQRKEIISDMKDQIGTEVSAQLVPHAARLEQLHDEQTLLKKQLAEISNQLQHQPAPIPALDPQHLPALPADESHLQAGHSVQHQPTHQVLLPPASHHHPPQPGHSAPQQLSQNDIVNIQAAKCSLTFAPITIDDLIRMKSSESENVCVEELLKRALNEFLDVNMNIPTSTISRMNIKNIYHSQEIEFQTVTVEFMNICPVNTIFKYVKNLAPEQKVSINIPEILEPKHDELKNWSYHLRNSEPRHKTVIKFLGNDIALYAKKIGSRNWSLITSPPQIQPQSYQKRPRDDESDDSNDTNRKALKPSDADIGEHSVKAINANTDEKTSGIPKPTFKPVPCYSKPQPSPMHTPGGGFWKPEETCSPSSKLLRTNLGNC